MRGGVADIIGKLEHGKILIAYSGGLHHVQFPGENIPHLFKTLKLNLELVDLDKYKSNLKADDAHTFKVNVIKDLQARQARHTPK